MYAFASYFSVIESVSARDNCIGSKPNAIDAGLHQHPIANEPTQKIKRNNIDVGIV